MWCTFLLLKVLFPSFEEQNVPENVILFLQDEAPQIMQGMLGNI